MDPVHLLSVPIVLGAAYTAAVGISLLRTMPQPEDEPCLEPPSTYQRGIKIIDGSSRLPSRVIDDGENFSRLQDDPVWISANLEEMYSEALKAQEGSRFNRAAKYYQKALHIARAQRDHAKLASIYHQLGVLAQDRHHIEQAKHLYLASLEISATIHNLRVMAHTIHQIGL